MKNTVAFHCSPIHHSFIPHAVQHSPDVGRLAPRPAMSPKQRKKAARQNHSSDSSVTSPIATTNYREIHQTEVEALQSIYGDDFEPVENRRSAWQVGMFHPRPRRD